MRIGFDEQIFLVQQRGGISRYFVELIKALRADLTLATEPVPLPRWSVNSHLIDSGITRALPYPPQLPGTRRALHYLLQAAYCGLHWPGRTIVQSLDVLHATYYGKTRFSRSFQGARVCTLYDMIPETMPEYFPRGNPHARKLQAVTNSHAVIAISEHTRDQFLDVYGNLGIPIVVAHLGVSDFWFIDPAQHGCITTSELIYVGSRSGYKDFTVVLAALTELPPTVKLICTGGGSLTRSEMRQIHELHLEGRVRVRQMTDHELASAYRQALALVFPSRQEGFGLPILEAMASRCPAIVADTRVSREVAGSSALFFAPGDHLDLADKVWRLANDRSQRERLIGEALVHAKQFTWRKTAEGHIRAYGIALDRV